MTISTVLVLAGPSTERKLSSFTNIPHLIFNAWLTEEQKSQLIASRMAQPPIDKTVYPVVIASPNPENVLYPVHIKPVEFTREMFEAGISSYPDIREADTLVVMMKIDKESKLGSQFVLERVNKMLEYSRSQHPMTPIHIIGIMEEIFERGLTPMEYNLRADALQLAQQYQASYFECSEHSWDSWVAKSPENTQKSVLNRIYQLEVDKFKQSLDPSQLRAYQTQNRLPDVDLRTEYDRSKAISAMVTGLKDPAELKKRMRELPNTAKSTIEAEKLADQHRNGFWKKYEQFCTRHELNQQRFNQLANDLVYLEHDGTTRHDIYQEMRLLRQKIVEAEFIFRRVPLRVKHWKVPKTTSPQPHSLADKPEPSAPPITQRFTSSASFFRAEPASAARADTGTTVTSTTLSIIADSIREESDNLKQHQQKHAQLNTRFDEACKILSDRILETYQEAFRDEKRVVKVLSKLLKQPTQKLKAAPEPKPSESYSIRAIDEMAKRVLLRFVHQQKSKYPGVYANATEYRMQRELEGLLQRRMKKFKKSKPIVALIDELDQIIEARSHLEEQIQKTQTVIAYLQDPDTPAAMQRSVDQELGVGMRR